jgi:hypothetical protein
MTDVSILRQEMADTHRMISKLSDEIKTIQNFIAADERNVQHAVEAVRINAQQSLDNYRLSLAVKQSELQELQQEQARRQMMVGKMDEIARKEKEVQHLERERERVTNLYEKVRADLERLHGELDVMNRPVVAREAELVFGNGQRVNLPTYDGDMLIGCTDASDRIFPDIDLTPHGGSSAGVSRKHATLTLRNGQWSIRDENSTNGTFLNETRLAAHVPKVLTNQANLRFGTVVATFNVRTPNAPAPGKTRRLS